MNWDELQLFLSVARAGQLQAAGRLVGVDRTTVGRRLAQLEQRLGAPLFHRTRDGLTLTASGQQALPHAARMEVEARALEAGAAPASRVAGVVRLAVTEALAPFLVEQGLLSVSDAHPGLKVEVLSGNRRLDLTTGEAELALRVDPLRGAGLRARCVSRSAVALYASPGYLARRGTPKGAKQLAGHEVLLPAAELSHLPEARWLAAQSGVVEGFRSNSLPALVAAAKAGRGVVALTSSWGDREAELVRLFEVPKLPPRAMWLVSTDASSKQPACVVVMRAVVELFSRNVRRATSG